MKLLKTTAVAGLLVASSAATAVELSGNVALTTDYVWRGITQTDGAPAIQGGFDAAFAGGFYTGVWASNVDFTKEDEIVPGVFETESTNESIEVDLYAGWAGEYKGFGVDVGVIHYHYPTSGAESNFNELYAGVSFGPVSLTQYFGLDLGSDDIGDRDLGNYTDLNVDLGEFNGFAFAAHVGYFDLEETSSDYYDWKLAASTTYLGLDVEVAYTDTDGVLEAGNTTDDDTVTLTVSKSL